MTALQRALGCQLRQLRDAAGKTVEEVADMGVASSVKLWRIETAAVRIKIGDVRALCWFYGADPATTERLTQWTLAGPQQAWWEDLDDPLPSHDGLYAGLEADAQHLYTFERRYIPHLLQTPDYTDALYRAVMPEAEEATAHAYQKLWDERRTALNDGAQPLRLTAVLDESILARPGFSTLPSQEQVDLLQELAGRLHIDIRFLPWYNGAHPASHTDAFTILEFPEPRNEDVVHSDTHTGARYTEEPAEVAKYRNLFTAVYKLSVPISEYQPGRGPSIKSHGRRR